MTFNNESDTQAVALDMDAEAAPQSPTIQEPMDPMLDFFPTNWRTIPQELYLYFASRASFFCPEEHHLLWIFDLSLQSLMEAQGRIRQSGPYLSAVSLQSLEQIQGLLTRQLRIMQVEIVHGVAAAMAYAETES